MASIGALTAYTQSKRRTRDVRMLELAIKSYQSSVTFLGDRVRSERASWDPLSMLSLAFLLSLFEVWLDSS